MAATPSSTWVHDLVARTPDDRDRVVDLLRAVALLAVATGHWLIAIVRPGADGGIAAASALGTVDGVPLLTWVFQVMPLFFLVGGVVNARSWHGARTRGETYGGWLAARLRRLVVPAAAAVALWTAALGVLAVTGAFPTDLLALAGINLAIPLWFLAVYVGVVAAAPAALAWHHRAGLAVPVALTAGAVVVDVLHRAGVPLIGWANFALVWLVPQQLGFAWADGRIAGRRAGVAAAVTGIVALVTLTVLGPYPVSVVQIPGAEASNNAPPTVVLLALTAVQLGVLLLIHPALTRWLQRPRVWAVVVVLNLRAMTVYLWHMPALLIGAVLLVPAGLVVDVDPGTAAWWASRPVWLAQLAVVLALLLPLVGRLERLGAPAAPGRLGVPRTVVVGGGAVVGFGLLAATGVPIAGSGDVVPATAGVAALCAAALAARGRAQR